MTIALAQWMVILAGLYVLVGLVFSVAFVLVGAQRVDPDAGEGTWGFRVLIFPAAVALWPLLALRWKAADGRHPLERNAHRDRARPEATQSGGGE